jgi:hypothetical protein
MLKSEFIVTNKKENMLIKSLEQMETIVAQNKVLSWDGWTVLERYPSDKGRTSDRGVYQNGIWHLQKMFAPTRDGWEVPSKYVR